MRSRLIVALIFAVLFVLGAWWIMRRPQPGIPPAPTPSPAGDPVQSPTASPAAARPVGFRLAGVAVGQRSSFAVFADPSGQTALYRVGEEVPGLGKLVHVEEGRAVIAGDRGDLEFRVRPAPTATRDLRSPTAMPKSSPTKPRPPSPAPPAGGSPPSGELDR